MSFERRMGAAVKHENAALEAIRARAWDAEPFGQSQLSEQVRAHLRDYRTSSDGKTSLRWLPDIIAARRMPHGKTIVRLIDAKAGERWRKTGNHDIEKDALAAAETWELAFGIPVYFVFTDWSYIDTERLRNIQLREGPNYGNGSGTPYWLFSRECCKPFDVLFPPLEA